MKVHRGAIVLVADGAKMLLLRNDGDVKFTILDVIDHSEIDNPASHEQTTDGPGRSFFSMGSRRSSYDEHDAHDRREKQFAIRSAAALAKVASQEKGEIIVIAPPATLHVLRDHYDRKTRERLVAEIDKDLTGHPVSEIARILAAQEPPLKVRQ